MQRSINLAAALLVLVAACGSDDETGSDPTGDPYTSEPGTTVVVGPGAGRGTVTTTPVGDGCITLPTGECVKPQSKCGAAERADVVVDSKGKVVEIVCYPASSTPTPIDGQGNVDLGKDNKGVVSIDGLADGVDVAGNVSSRGNNVTVYGEGPSVSVIGGDVDAEGNNFSMRGVTVKGDVRAKGNNAALVLCFIEGDLVIEGNNAVIAECTVLGKVLVKGNNGVLVGNSIRAGLDVRESKNTVCDGNVGWSDANGNRVLDAGESGAAIGCQ